MSNMYDKIMDKLEIERVDLKPIVELSEAKLASIEAQLGYPLPADYREFLRKYGLCHSYGHIDYTDEDDPSKLGGTVGVFYGFKPGDSYDLVGSRRYIEEEWLPAHMVSVASGDGTEYCLSLDGPDKGCVYWWNQHGGSLDWHENAELIFHSFYGFVNSLVLTESGEVDE